MVQLQTPEWVWYDGGIRPWQDATFHISSEALVRGLNVFEGLKGYWQPDGRFGVLAMARHHARLVRSARLLHIPFEEDLAAFTAAHHALLERLVVPEQEAWIRATLYVQEGHWGELTKSNLVLTAYNQPKGTPSPMRIGVSSWRRAADSAMPCRVKTSANYQVARLARIEGRSRNYDEMLLTNQFGRIAEASGACVMIVRDGTVITPPPHEGALESITLDIARSLAADLGIPWESRPLEHSELKMADEVALTGTLTEITTVEEVDGYLFPPAGPVFTALQTRFMDAVTGRDPHPAADLDFADS